MLYLSALKMRTHLLCFVLTTIVVSDFHQLSAQAAKCRQSFERNQTMTTLDLSNGEIVHIGANITLTIVINDDGSVSVDVESKSPTQVLPSEFVGLELHQLQTLSMNDL